LAHKKYFIAKIWDAARHRIGRANKNRAHNLFSLSKAPPPQPKILATTLTKITFGFNENKFI